MVNGINLQGFLKSYNIDKNNPIKPNDKFPLEDALGVYSFSAGIRKGTPEGEQALDNAKLVRGILARFDGIGSQDGKEGVSDEDLTWFAKLGDGDPESLDSSDLKAYDEMVSLLQRGMPPEKEDQAFVTGLPRE